jgi:hypothetical protein
MGINQMNRKNNIFYGITKMNENSSTELLCNILRTKYLRDIILKYFGIAEDVLNEINIENIKTQKTLKDTGIPDIIIQTKSCYYIIENKIRIDTHLQKSQKEEYVEDIISKKENHRGYIFLIPEKYRHREEIEEIKEKNQETIIIKEWEDFLSHLEKLEIENESPVIKESLDYLRAFFLREAADINLSPYEVAMLFNLKNVFYSLNLINKFKKIIGDNEKDFIKSLGNDFSASDFVFCFDAASPYLKGKHINYKENQCIFYGFDFDLLDKKDDFIFSVRFDKNCLNSLNVNLETDEFSDVYDDGNFIYIKTDAVNLISENDNSKYFEELADIIKKVLKI